MDLYVKLFVLFERVTMFFDSVNCKCNTYNDISLVFQYKSNVLDFTMAYPVTNA